MYLDKFRLKFRLKIRKNLNKVYNKHILKYYTNLELFRYCLEPSLSKKLEHIPILI
jgi:hypothetical protein